MTRTGVIVSGILLWLTGLLPAGAALPPDEAARLLAESRDLFTQANAQVRTDPEAARDLYRKAALRLERIDAEGGFRNGRLLYNLGNTYYRMEDLGRAILAYRRAARLIPHDPNLHQNLEHARSRRLDRVEPTQETRVLRTLFFWHFDGSTRARSAVFLAAYGIFWLGLIVRRIRPLPGARAAWIAGLVFALLTGGSLAVDWHAARTASPGVVIENEVIARKGDSESYEPSFTRPLHAGTEFVLLEARSGWYHVRLEDGRTCWIPVRTAGLVDPARADPQTQRQASVEAEAVNPNP